MKKAIAVIVILLIIIFGFSLLIVGLSTGVLQQKTSGPKTTFDSKNYRDDYISTTIGKGDLLMSQSVSGEVMETEPSISLVEISSLKKDFSICISAGSIVEKNDVIAVNGKKDILAPCDGYVTEISYQSGLKINIYDYRKTAILVGVSEKYQQYLLDDLYITVEDPVDGSVCLSKIIAVSSSINEGMVGVIIENPFNLFIGSTLNVMIEYDTFDDVVLVSKQFVQFDKLNKQYYVQTYNEETDLFLNLEISVGKSNDLFYEVINGDSLVGKEIVISKVDLLVENMDEDSSNDNT